MTGKVWFVTGSSRGLGLQIVLAALRSGDRVAATARHPGDLAGLAAGFGESLLPLRLDVTDAATAAGAVQRTIEVFGRLDVVVNNAGYADLAAFEDTAPEVFTAQLDTNLSGVINVSRAVIPVLRAQGGGHLINVSSLGGRIGTPGLSAYQAAKWAVTGFSEVLAAETRPLGHEHTSISQLEALVEQGLQPVEVLDPCLARLRRRQVQVQLHGEVGRDWHPGLIRQRGHFQKGRNAPDPRRVRLQDVNCACVQQPPVLGHAGQHLARRDRRVQVTS